MILFQCNAKDVELLEGNIVCLTTDPEYEEFVTEDTIFVDYRKTNQVVEPGSRILIDCVEGGQVRLSALEIGNTFGYRKIPLFDLKMVLHEHLCTLVKIKLLFFNYSPKQFLVESRVFKDLAALVFSFNNHIRLCSVKY